MSHLYLKICVDFKIKAELLKAHALFQVAKMLALVYIARETPSAQYPFSTILVYIIVFYVRP